METIKNYLDNMFANLPQTNQMLKLKNDILSNMEEKYNEHKNDGKSENEAIGIVISEFGNIDELINELGIEHEKEEVESLRTVTLEEAESFIAAKKHSGLLVGIGTFLCIIGVALLILTFSLIDNHIIGENLSDNVSDMISIIPLFILLVPAVGLFIYSGMTLEKYKYLQNNFNLPLRTKVLIEQKYNAFTSTYNISVILGVCLCVLSPIAVFVASALDDDASSYGFVILLMIISVAVFLFVYFGNIKGGFTMLLKLDSFSKAKEEDNKVIGAVAAIIWPLATCIFLISGFIFGLWHIAWIIFPITGILFGMFSAVYNIVKGNHN